MILADTSVWIDHLRHGNRQLSDSLRADEILSHPFVMGELVCGGFPGRDALLRDLGRLPAAVVARHEEALQLLESHRLWGTGLGWIDVHLLASALLTGCRLWTLDHRLASAAGKSGVKL